MYKLLIVLALVAIANTLPVAEQQNEEDAKINSDLAVQGIPEPPTEDPTLETEVNSTDSDEEELEAFFDGILKHFNITDSDESGEATTDNPVGESESDKEIEASLDEFLKFLNSTNSDEINEEVVKVYLISIFKGLDEILTGLEQLPDFHDPKKDEGFQHDDSEIRHTIPIETTTEALTSPNPPTKIDNQKIDGQENEINVDDSPASCLTEKGFPGTCVPFYSCEVFNEGEIFGDFITLESSCPSFIEICCSSEHIRS